MAGELSDHGEREQGREGVALAARVALIRHAREMGGQGLDTEGEGQVGGQLERERQGGRVHRTPSMGMIGYQHAYHTLPKVSFLLSDFAQALMGRPPS